MKKVELVEAVAKKTGLTKADATRASVKIPARKAVTFKAGSALKEAVNK